MKEHIKIVLLAVIAGTLVIQTALQLSNDTGSKESIPASAIQQTTTITPAANQITPDKPDVPKTSIKFQEENFDFGNIKQDSENKHIFKFTNTGNNPLIIENAKGSCGCTVPQWPKEPIPPSGTGEIEVVYKPGKQKSNQKKTVTIHANTEPKETRITISALVEEI